MDVTKKCSLAPCALEADYLNMNSMCDQDKDNFFCSHCCKDNGCNRGSNSSSSNANIVLSIVIMASLVRRRSMDNG